MARIADSGISGVIGPVIFYTRNGEKYIRTKPRKMKKKRSAAVGRSNTVFGTVSTYGSAMIKRISKSFLFPFNLDTYNRLRGWMRNQYAAHQDDTIWEPVIQHGSMCQVNPETDLRELFMADITVSNNGSGKISISIPAMDPQRAIRAPKGTMKLNMKCIAVTSPFKESGIPYTFCMEEYKFKYSDNSIPAKEILLDTKAAERDIAIVVIALEYEMAGGIYNMEKRWLPAAVVAMGRIGM